MPEQEQQVSDSQRFKREMYKPPTQEAAVEVLGVDEERAQQELQELLGQAQELRNAAHEALPEVATFLSEEERVAVAKLTEQYQELSGLKKDTAVSDLDYALEKMAIFQQMNTIVDDVQSRMFNLREQVNRTPKGGESYRPASKQEIQAAKKDGPTTGFVSNMGEVHQQRAEQTAEADQEDTEITLTSVQLEQQAQREVAAAWDSQAKSWLTWAKRDDNLFYDPDIDTGDVWKKNIPQDRIRATSGLDQQQFFEMTNALRRLKAKSVEQRQAA